MPVGQPPHGCWWYKCCGWADSKQRHSVVQGWYRGTSCQRRRGGVARGQGEQTGQRGRAAAVQRQARGELAQCSQIQIGPNGNTGRARCIETGMGGVGREKRQVRRGNLQLRAVPAKGIQAPSLWSKQTGNLRTGWRGSNVYRLSAGCSRNHGAGCSRNHDGCSTVRPSTRGHQQVSSRSRNTRPTSMQQPAVLQGGRSPGAAAQERRRRPL